MDLQKIRADFPILSREVYGKPLVYFDNGATTQKPRQVVDAITDEYYSVNANVHRGVHFLSQQATELHEASRETARSSSMPAVRMKSSLPAARRKVSICLCPASVKSLCRRGMR